ncbi:hypothetical protein PLESTM_000271600 [Pleodorina starrii]|nr:hypothetical protein PLESTM_000271600 [Pleodorina starrii]
MGKFAAHLYLMDWFLGYPMHTVAYGDARPMAPSPIIPPVWVERAVKYGRLLLRTRALLDLDFAKCAVIIMPDMCPALYDLHPSLAPTAGLVPFGAWAQLSWAQQAPKA